MIGYVTVGTNDLNKASAFYDALFATIGVQRALELERIIAWGKPGQPGFSIALPFDGKPATAGNGNMTAIAFNSTAEVDAFYNKAIALGATDEGALGERFPGFYAGYFRDLDGNKLNAFYMAVPTQV